MKYKLAIFDLDGTILNTLDDLHNSVNFSLEKYGFPLRTKAEIRNFLGNGALNLIKKSLPEDVDIDSVTAVYSDYIAHYQENCNNRTAPYDGIIDLLKELRRLGIATAVVSNKPDNTTKELCKLHFADLFDSVIGDRSGINKKPAPDSVIETMNAMNVSVDETIYIGDSEVDVLTAKNAGTDCIAVSWGFRDVDLLINSGAVKIADSPAQILDEITR